MRQQKCSTIGKRLYVMSTIQNKIAQQSTYLRISNYGRPTMVDYFTHFLVAVSIQNITTVRLSQSLVNHCLSFDGAPATIMTDRGTQIKFILFNEITGLLGIRWLQITAYHPHSNEMVKLLHHTPETSLTAQPDHYNWAHYLPLVLLPISLMIKED